MVKALTAFRTYVLHSKVISYVPTSSIKDILVQLDSDGRRGQWLAKIQEFDLEVKPTKLVKVQGLDTLLAESNFRAFEINHLEYYEGFPDIDEFYVTIPATKIQEKFSSFAWYNDIVSYLLTL
jgi:hypothetical protein